MEIKYPAKCKNCKKKLRLWTIPMTVQNGAKPVFFQNRQSWPNHEGRAIVQITKRRPSIHDLEKSEDLTCWLGDYSGYGHAPGEKNPLFCTLRCALTFAKSAYRAGHR